MKENLFQYLLLLGDNPFILGHRLSELCGHGPSLETDIALTNISLDCFGQVRNYYQYAATLQDKFKTEDEIAFLRYEQEYRNVILVEQPNTDFAWTIGRQFLFDAFHLPLLEQLMHSKDESIAGIASKSIKEVRYHLRFSSEWVKRLGDGTDESREKMQKAIEVLWLYAGELFMETDIEKEMKANGIGADLDLVKSVFMDSVLPVLNETGLTLPAKNWHHSGGKSGVHSEYMGYMLAQLQYMQRAYPNMAW